MLENSLHVNICKVLNIDFKRLNPINNFITSIIDLKDSMKNGFIKVNTLINKMNLFELLEMNWFY